ncbi:MAG TPA: hypothetical protein VN832_04655 [Stellaceae bacterium]|nr:hypothetical protein [Stellaceae bacterium]
MSRIRILTLTLAALFATGLAANAMAETKWQKDHPRRHEVNQRLRNQDKRINSEYKSGQITKQKAAQLHHEDRQVRREERQMASQDGGHITKTEQHTLNQQENGISRQIGR